MFGEIDTHKQCFDNFPPVFLFPLPYLPFLPSRDPPSQFCFKRFILSVKNIFLYFCLQIVLVMFTIKYLAITLNILAGKYTYIWVHLCVCTCMCMYTCDICMKYINFYDDFEDILRKSLLYTRRDYTKILVHFLLISFDFSFNVHTIMTSEFISMHVNFAHKIATQFLKILLKNESFS